MRFRSFVAASALLLFGVLATAPRDVAYAATTSPPSMGQAIGAVVAAAATARGFSAADPRIAETIAAIGDAALASASAFATASGQALTSVPWVAAFAPLALFAAGMSVPTSLGNDSLTQWQLNHDGTVTVSQSSGGGLSDGSSPYAPLTVGGIWWSGAGGARGSSAEAVLTAYLQLSSPTLTPGTCTVYGTDPNKAGSCTFYDQSGVKNSVGVSEQGNWAGPACSTGIYYGGACQAYSAPPPPPPVTESLSAAVSSVSAGDMADDLNPYVLAAATNALWAQAAQGEGYAGLPYPVSAPVTTTEAQGVESQLGAAAPTVGSAVSGAGTLAGAGSAPFAVSAPAASNPASSVPVATNPGSGAQVNLGPDPGIGSPSLEQVPTASQILAPVLALLPDLKSFSVPAHNAVCPEPSITLFGSSITVTAQCTLSEQFRSEIYGTFVLAFSLAAMFILLTA